MKHEFLAALGTMNKSLSALEQSALESETQSQAIAQALSGLTSAVGQLNDRLGRYLDDADRQGARINDLERQVRELRNVG
jgi:methyl-accepting chemotaxis protein